MCGFCVLLFGCHHPEKIASCKILKNQYLIHFAQILGKPAERTDLRLPRGLYGQLSTYFHTGFEDINRATLKTTLRSTTTNQVVKVLTVTQIVIL